MLFGVLVCVAACEPGRERPRPARDASPRVTDADLAELLDHVAFNLGMATDSLEARGFRVGMRRGDTLWLRAAPARWRFVRDADSALVGFYLVTPEGRHRVHYGTGVDINLVEYATAFLRAPR